MEDRQRLKPGDQIIKNSADKRLMMIIVKYDNKGYPGYWYKDIMGDIYFMPLEQLASYLNSRVWVLAPETLRKYLIRSLVNE